MKEENLFAGNAIRTYGGYYLDVFNINPQDIHIRSIAHGLAMKCRFSGHMNCFYTIAQHSIDVAQRVDKKYKLAALLHDASEAYICDIASPIKKHLTEYKKIEDNLMKEIAKKYGFEYPLHEQIKQADYEALEFEWNNMVIENNCNNLNILSPQEAKLMFIREFKKYYYEVNKN